LSQQGPTHTTTELEMPFWLPRIAVAAALATQSGAIPFADAPYRDPTLPIPDRVDDLLAKMALEEKVAQVKWPEPPNIPNIPLHSPTFALTDMVSVLPFNARPHSKDNVQQP